MWDVIACMEGKRAGVRPVPEPEEELPWVQVVPSATSRCCRPSYRNEGNAPPDRPEGPVGRVSALGQSP